MSNRAAEIEVKLLLFAIQRTTTFENLLAQRFAYANEEVSFVATRISIMIICFYDSQTF